jgi:sacsin
MPADPSFGLKISPGVVLRNVLQQYPSGGQFFLEALQNADDTGRATKFCAMLDLRRHPAASVRPPLEARQGLQGEAILFYDNAGFKDRDWRSLQFMCDSEKRQSPHEAGIFGMGSRSFFHITDVIQVLSHRKLSALDPDDILESGHFGEQVDFLESNLVDKFPDECAPFVGLFDCDMRGEFSGSIIRCSLRNEERAKKCTFMPQSFEIERAEKIFADFEETLKNGEVALFLTCIQNVELWRWDPDAKEPKRIACTQLGVSSGHTLPEAMSSPSEAPATGKRERERESWQ